MSTTPFFSEFLPKLRPSMARIAVVSGICVLSACASPNYDVADRAREDLSTVRDDNDIDRYAGVQLQRAEKALSRMESAIDDGAPRDEVEHLAYLASKRAEISKQRAEAAATYERINDLGGERNEILIALEQQRADVAEEQAATASAEAEKALQEAQAERDRATQLELAMEELQAEQTARGLVLTLNDVLFELDQSTLKPGGMKRIEQIASRLQDLPEANVLIEGHTDDTGSESYNQQLSSARAAAVRDAFVQNGLSANRLSIRGLGEDYPVASNDTKAGRQQNRRVEVIVGEESS